MSDIYRSANLLDIKGIYKYELGKYMHKIANNCLPNHIIASHRMLTSTHTYHTRQAAKNFFDLPQVKSLREQQTTVYAGANLWNAIPDSIKNTNYHTYCKSLKSYLMQQDPS